MHMGAGGGMLLPGARREEQRQDLPMPNQEDTWEAKCLSKTATETWGEGTRRIDLHDHNMVADEITMARWQLGPRSGLPVTSQDQSSPPHPGNRSQTLEAK